MATATKVLCQSCGAKNRSGVERCAVCTRPLTVNAGTTQLQFENQLYGRPVRTAKPPRGEIHPVLVVVSVIAVILGLNYFVIGWGPAFAHRPEAVVPGEMWLPFHGTDWSANLPHDSISDTVITPTGQAERVWAGVDDVGQTVIGGQSLAPGLAARGNFDLVTVVTVTAGTAPAELSAAAASMVQASLPGTQLSRVTVTPIPRPAVGTEVKVIATFVGGSPLRGSGTVLSRVISVGGRAYVLSTFTHDGTSADLQDRLVAGFRTDAAR
jgi:hypothetical protein